MSKNHPNGGVRLFLKQSIKNRSYLYYTFQQLSHYCGNYPHTTKAMLKGKSFQGVQFVTRSLFCFNELYQDFYFPTKKVHTDIYNIITIQGLAH